jgi:hypothetical protein
LPKPLPTKNWILPKAAARHDGKTPASCPGSQSTPAPPDRETLTRLAQEYSQARRSDTQALAIYERLANFPDCELRWLMTWQ